MTGLRRSFASVRSANMSLEVKNGIATIADFVASGKVGADARGRAATAFKDTIGVMLAGASRASRANRALDGRGGRCRRVPHRWNIRENESGPCRVRQRRRRTFARLRRHVLRLARASELRAGARRPCRGRAGPCAPTALLDAYVDRLRARVPAGKRDEPAPLPSSAAGTAPRPSGRSARPPRPHVSLVSTPPQPSTRSELRLHLHAD